MRPLSGVTPEHWPRRALYFGGAERSDAMWSERLQWEAATDLAPEQVAELARTSFGETARSG
jgi:hypothetical protein